jgi:hypothetical protein
MAAVPTPVRDGNVDLTVHESVVVVASGNRQGLAC